MPPELRKIIREHPCLRMEAILFGDSCLHCVESVSKFIFACNGVYTWKVVDGLVKVHPNEGVRANRMIGPANIPICFFLIFYAPHTKRFSDLLYNWIVRD